MSQKPPQEELWLRSPPSRAHTYLWRAGLPQDQLAPTQHRLRVRVLGELLLILLVDWG